jgi:hypothetical protein
MLGLNRQLLCETPAFALKSVSLVEFLDYQFTVKNFAELNSIAQTVSYQIEASYKTISMVITIKTCRVRCLSELDCLLTGQG